MTMGHVMYKLDPTLSPVRPRWSLPRATSPRPHRRPVRSIIKGR
jgi:hypothetical protein